MAKRKSYKELVSKFEPDLRRAFLASIDEIKDKVVLNRLVAALEAGDIERAINVLAIEQAAYEVFQEARSAAYLASGRDAVATMPRDALGPVVVRFDARSPGAERWLGQDSSNKITRIVEEQKQAVRLHLQDAMTRGDNPLTAALDIVGRIDPQTKRRVGGVLGLSGPQERAVAAARLELSDPATMTNFLGRKMRDRRYDHLIRKALSEERGLNAHEMHQVIGRYSDRLLKLRGETIGRTEMMAALHAGNRQAYQQAIDNGDLVKEEVKRSWDTTGDGKVRDTHQSLDGQTVGFDDYYISSSGAQILFPGDPNAPASEVINCRCNELYRIDFIARARREMGLPPEPPPPEPINPILAKLPELKDGDNLDVTGAGADNGLTQYTQDKKLNGDEIASARYYQGTGYKPINGFLRGDGPGEADIDYLGRKIDSINTAIGKSKLDKELTLYRGVGNSTGRYSNLAVGDVVDNDSFQSYSSNSGIAASFARKDGGVVFRTVASKGESAMYFDKSESEFLFASGRQIKVLRKAENVKIEKRFNGQRVNVTVYDVEFVP